MPFQHFLQAAAWNTRSLGLFLCASVPAPVLVPLAINYSRRTQTFLCAKPSRTQPSRTGQSRIRNAAVSYTHISRPQWARRGSKNSATKIASASTLPGCSLFYVRSAEATVMSPSFSFPPLSLLPLYCLRLARCPATTPGPAQASLPRSPLRDVGRYRRASLRVVGVRRPGASGWNRKQIYALCAVLRCAGPQWEAS